MKWLEIESAPNGTLLINIINGRVAKLIDKFGDPLRKITVRYLDGELVERTETAPFKLAGPPAGNVSRKS